MTGRRFILSSVTTPLIAAVVMFAAEVFRGELSWAQSAATPLLRFFVYVLVAELFVALPCLALLRYRGVRLLTASVTGGALAGLLSALVKPFCSGFSFNALFLFIIVGALSGVVFWFTAFWKSDYEVQEIA
ncbi:MAG: hypothetical protein HY231_10860 [Acidobacteria bacterium]|nr:hypothetical protein [Acidobacteriota bacterium]